MASADLDCGLAVFFYQHMGSAIAEEVDEELFQKEPYDIHMIKEL